MLLMTVLQKSASLVFLLKTRRLLPDERCLQPLWISIDQDKRHLLLSLL